MKKKRQGVSTKGERGKPSQLEIYLRSMCNSDKYEMDNGIIELTGDSLALALPLSHSPIEGWHEADIHPQLHQTGHIQIKSRIR